jgi:hypothetical protein
MKGYFEKKTGWLGVFYVLILIGYILSQLPFLNADADLIMASGSRGSWTDEGLNTCQIRNLVNHGHFNLLDSDNFLKTPFFSLFLFPFFKLFGISMLGARLITVLFCATLLLTFFLRKTTLFIGVVFVVTTMLLFPIHQYSHLCLAEMYSSILIVVAALVYSFYPTENRYLPLVLLFALFSLSVLFKIQFIYVLAIPLLIKTADYILDSSIATRNQLIAACIILIFVVFGCVFIWYFPFKEAWLQIAKQQSGGFSIEAVTFDLIYENTRQHFFSRRYIMFTVFFVFSFFIAIKHIVSKQHPKEYITLLMVSVSWIIVELHKLGFTYLPIRYLISFYLSMGFLMSVVIGYYLFQATIIERLLAISCLLAMFLMNSYFYKQAFFSRSFSVKNMNTYFRKLTSEHDVVIGAWAPAFTWETKCYSYPIWTNFLGERDIMNYYRPNFIVSEYNQEDSGFAYEKNEINLDDSCDSLTQSKVALWKLNVYRVKK